MSKQLAGFMKFVRTQGVVGLAVGLAIGTQAGATVKAIVDGFINPLVGFIIGNTNGLADAKWHIVAGERSMTIGYGAILSSAITLLAVAAVIYYVVHGFKLDRLDAKKDD